jgi:hypothetical protein
LDPRVERVLFALVANRALDASSKLAAAGWVSDDVHIDGLPEVSDDACHRATDWLIEIHTDLEREVFGEASGRAGRSLVTTRTSPARQAAIASRSPGRSRLVPGSQIDVGAPGCDTERGQRVALCGTCNGRAGCGCRSWCVGCASSVW